MRQFLRYAKDQVVTRLVHAGYAEAFNVRLRDQLGAVQPTLVLDVGANEGQYAYLVRRLGYRGPIVSFEPQPANAARLRELAARDTRWRILEVAVGDETGSATLHVTHETVFSSIMHPNVTAKQIFGGQVAVNQSVAVGVKKLDDLLRELGIVASRERIHLKTDTQGYDMRVVRGARDALAYVHSLQCEVSLIQLYEGAQQTAYLDDLREIHNLGFALTALSPVVRDRSKRIIEADALFLR